MLLVSIKTQSLLWQKEESWRRYQVYNVKQSINGKFPSNYKASTIGFETQISLRR